MGFHNQIRTLSDQSWALQDHHDGIGRSLVHRVFPYVDPYVCAHQNITPGCSKIISRDLKITQRALKSPRNCTIAHGHSWRQQQDPQDDGGRWSLRRVFPYVEPHAWALASIAQTTTVWLVLLVTVDRYFAVCLPMKVLYRGVDPCETGGTCPPNFCIFRRLSYLRSE